MADKSFGLKQVNLIGASGTPRIESPNNLNINATNVAISTDMSVGGTVTIGTGATISSPATNVLTLGTNSVERVRITSTGIVGIGSDNPQAPLNVLNNNANTPTVWIRNTSSGGDSPALRVQGGANNNNTVGTFEVRDYDGNVDFKVGGTGTVTIGNGNLVFSTAGTGIDFSATTDAPDGGSSTSELLDDYEEGTWTPTITWGGTSATLSSSTYGYYTKIGNTVIINFRITQTARNTTSGAIRMQGLPYDEASSANYNHGMVQGDAGINMPTGAGSIMLYLEGGNHRWLYQTNTGHADLNASECVDGTSFYGFATYFTS